MPSKTIPGKYRPLPTKPPISKSHSPTLFPNSTIHIPSVNLINEFSIRQILKRSPKYIHNLLIGLEILNNTSASKILRYFKRVKYTNLLLCDALFYDPIRTSKALRLFYTTTRGISSTSLAIPSNPLRFNSLKILFKFKYLTQLHLKTGNLEALEPYTMLPKDYKKRARSNRFFVKEIKSLNSSLTVLRNLKTLVLLDNYHFSHDLVFKTLAKQIELKKPLMKKLAYCILKKYRAKHDNLAIFLKSLDKLEFLEEIQLHLEGLDMTQANINLLSQSLSQKKFLKSASLALKHPVILPSMINLSLIKPLTLDLCFKTIDFDLNTLRLVLPSITNPIIIRLEQIHESQKTIDPDYVENFFGILAQLPKLTQFYYKESQGTALSPVSCLNIITSLSEMLKKVTGSLEKLHIVIEKSRYLGILLQSLTALSKNFTYLKAMTLTVCEYSVNDCSKKMVLKYLESLRQIETLKEVGFLLDGVPDIDFSQKAIDSCVKCRGLLSLEIYSLSVDSEGLLYIMKNIAELRHLEKLLLWFNPVERGDITRGFEDIKEELFDKVGKTVKMLENLKNLCLMFALPGFGERDIQDLRRTLKQENMKLNVKIY